MARALLGQEASGLLMRLARIKSFSLSMPMVVAAQISPEAQAAIEELLDRGCRELRHAISGFVSWLQGAEGRTASAADAQARFTFLRLRFNAIVSQFDIFNDVLAQRGEHETGVWVAGLDDVAADALALPGGPFAPPPVVCYLDRGHGAAIRRVRTRLPGGDLNPVAVIRVPRERMIGSGIASSLVHEVGHQAAAMLDLVASLRQAMPSASPGGAAVASNWRFWDRWISEIVADLWSVARVGVGSTLGLLAVVSLPRPFVFRLDLEDPHPAPWLRVKLSCAMGAGLYPHPQWGRLAKVWAELYPLGDLPKEQRALIERLDAGVEEFVRFLLAHRPASLDGRSIKEALALAEMTPARLGRLFSSWGDAGALPNVRPCLAFAAIGQAKANGAVSARQEAALLSRLLTAWAYRGAAAHNRRKRSVAMPVLSSPTPPPRLAHFTAKEMTS